MTLERPKQRMEHGNHSPGIKLLYFTIPKKFDKLNARILMGTPGLQPCLDIEENGELVNNPTDVGSIVEVSAIPN